METTIAAPVRIRLADLFVRERQRFLRFVQRQLFESDTPEAEDIVSDVVFGLLRRADVIGEIENLSAYVYRSLSNRVTDYRRAKVQTVALDQSETDDNSVPLEIPDTRPDPTQALEQQEIRKQICAAIESLSPPERAVWLATEIDGRTFRELADEWGEPIGTLLSRKSRAVIKLRASLADYRPQDPAKRKEVDDLQG